MSSDDHDSIHRVQMKALILSPKDNVATALTRLRKSEDVTVLKGSRELQIKLKSDIPFGHKFALDRIRRGEMILKHGYPIGVALKTISRGEHVHIQNLQSLRGRGRQFEV